MIFDTRQQNVITVAQIYGPRRQPLKFNVRVNISENLLKNVKIRTIET